MNLTVVLLAVATLTLDAQSAGRGVPLFEAGDWAGARTEFAAAVQRNDRDARAHYYLGRLAMLENDADTAATEFERAVTLDQNVAEYHWWHGSALEQQGMRASMLKQSFSVF